ncbi:MAG: UDP-2,3-diacylglucosamine diphosphatase LpxI [Puniceicoccales bacterium]|nr:UDP-2,3-diacylglucosamine diphosphatase LpxI [Puniceicoccales bacterium]
MFSRRKKAVPTALSTTPVPTRFLPDNFLPSDGISLLAGRGDYPLLCASRMQAAGIPVSLVASEDASDELYKRFSAHCRVRYNAGQMGKVLQRLRENGHRWAIMAGQIAPKRLFHGLKFDWTAIRMLTRLRRRNAETIFGALAESIEKCGVKILDARAFMDEDLAAVGFMTQQHRPLVGVEHGIEVARAVAALDIGQGVVVHRGTVLAVEGFDGTDKMLIRCNAFKTEPKWFIKTSKPNQDFRFDVPTVGLRTLESMREGGISGIAVESGRTLLFGRKIFLQHAERLGIVVYGYE